MRDLRPIPALLSAILFTSCAHGGGTAPRTTPAPAPPASAATATAVPVQPPAPVKPPAPGGPLGELDQLFLESYQHASDRVKQSQRPAVVVSGSSLVLHTSTTSHKPVRVIPDVYHALKSVAHTPFAVYLRLDAEAGSPLTQETAAALDLFQKRIPPARTHIAGFKLAGDQLARQTALLDKTEALIASALKNQSVSRADLLRYAQDVGPLLMKNTEDAGCAQIVGTHAQMKQWRKEFPNERWDKVIVINRSAHQARYRNAATLYFAWLLGDQGTPWSYPGESMRVIYAEVLFGQDDPLDLMATVSLDAEASEAFFGDRWRLSEDVLSDGAAKCIAQFPSAERWLH